MHLAHVSCFIKWSYHFYSFYLSRKSGPKFLWFDPIQGSLEDDGTHQRDQLVMAFGGSDDCCYFGYTHDLLLETQGWGDLIFGKEDLFLVDVREWTLTCHFYGLWLLAPPFRPTNVWSWNQRSNFHFSLAFESFGNFECGNFRWTRKCSIHTC